MARQASEQYFTSAQFLAQLLRQVISRPHTMQTLLGNAALLPLNPDLSVISSAHSDSGACQCGSNPDATPWVRSGMCRRRFTSKPYVASGAYVKRMSNYCTGCKYEPETRVGTNACPMTTLYWNFLDKHEETFGSNPRTALMVKNLQRMTPELRAGVREKAKEMLADLNNL